MKLVISTTAAAVLLTAGLMVFIMKTGAARQTERAEQAQLNFVQQAVGKRLADVSAHIDAQLHAFADVVAGHKDFSLKVLVENDRSSPLVTEMAGQFLKPMGFSVLEISDSAWTILSSGHFPASAGNNSILRSTAAAGTVRVCMADIMGTPTLTLQSQRGFAIAGIPFHVAGGVTIDAALLARLAPAPGVTVLLNHNGSYIGMENVRSISAIKDGQIIINDEKYPAVEIQVPVAGDGEKVSLLAILKE